MDDQGRKDSYDVIMTSLFDSNVKLSESDQKLIEILRDTYTYWLDKPILTDIQIRDYLIVTHHCSKQQAYNNISKIKMLLGSVPKAAKEFYRYKANYILDKATAAAEAGNDKMSKAFTKIADCIIKNNQLDADDGEAIPYSDIVPKDWSMSIDPTVVGIKPIPDIVKKAKKLLDSYIHDLEDFQYVEDGDDRTQIPQ